MNSRFILTVAVEHLSYLLMGKNPSILSMSVTSKSLVILFFLSLFLLSFSHIFFLSGAVILTEESPACDCQLASSLG